MKKNLFHTVQRCVAVVTSAAILLNSVGCGIPKQHPGSFSRVLDEEIADIDSGTEPATESPHTSSTEVKSAENAAKDKYFEPVIERGFKRTAEGNTLIVDFSEVSANADGSVEAPSTGVNDLIEEGVPTGPTPSTEASPFAADPTEKSDPLASVPSPGSAGVRPRVGDHDTPIHSRQTYPSIDHFEQNVQKDHEKIEGEFDRILSASQSNAVLAITEIDSAIEKHNASVDKALASAPGWQALVSGSQNASKFKSPASTPMGQGIRNAWLSIQYTRATVPDASGELLTVAEQTLAAADDAASSGHLSDAEARRQAVSDLVSAARCPSCLPLPPGKNAYELQTVASEQLEKSKSYSAARNLYDAANDLDKTGFSGLANDARKSATILLNIALGLARFSTVVDLPFNVLEALTQKTIVFDESGVPQMVEASTIEISFAVGTLALTAAAVATVGWPATLAVGIMAGLGKTVEKQIAKHSAEKAALVAAEEGLVGAAKEAAEQAAQAAAQVKANTVMQSAAKVASSGAMKNVSTKAMIHILEGNFNAAGQLKGGMHTGDATDRFIATLAPAIQKNVTRETLPNGVERTVFREVDKVLTIDAYKATVGAAEAGRGVAGGKSAFPRHWTDQVIDEAIGEVLANGRVIWDRGNGQYILEGKYQGVTLQVAVGPHSGGGSQVNSAYPSWNQ